MEPPLEIPENWGREPVRTRSEWTWQNTVTTIGVLAYLAFIAWLAFGD